MSGVEIVGVVLGGYGPLVARVSPDRMKGGALPEGIALPAILVTRISRVGGGPLSGGASRQRDRVQVTVRANDYAEQVAIQKLVVTALDGRVGTFGGVPNVAITSIGGGPDFADRAASIWMGSEDFSVSYPTL